MRNYGSQTPKRYFYSDVKKMTDSFNDKLGQGVGGVNKGMIGDGRFILVKFIYTSIGNRKNSSHAHVVNLF